MSAPDPHGPLGPHTALADAADGVVRQSVENGSLDRLWPSP